PGPYGPSRYTVGGTIAQPVSSETRYAASSRRARVPSGKSQSGGPPASGLYTHVASALAVEIRQYSVVLDASTSRPTTSSAPSVSSWCAAPWSSTEVAVTGYTDGRWPFWRGQMWPSALSGSPQNGPGGAAGG